MGGRKFTFYREEGHKFSKIDRFLVCPNFINQQPLSTVIALPHEHSDHSPLILSNSNADFGPLPFRFFNSWMNRPSFNEVFDVAWQSFKGFGSADRFLLSRLKHVKKALCVWGNSEYQKEKGVIKELRLNVERLEKAAELRPLSQQERTLWKEDKVKILELEKIANLDIRQKAKAKWICDGDENTKYFHGIIKSKCRRNRLHGLMIDNIWVTDPKAIKMEVHKFFAEKFHESWSNRPKFISPNFAQLSQDQKMFLETCFSPDEVKSAVWCCGAENAPGPDGFTFKLIKSK